MSKQEKSTRFLLRIEPNIYRRLLQFSKKHQKSINSICNQMIANEVQQFNPEKKWIDEIVKTHASSGLEAIILFGSQARGDASASSDTDILLVFDQKIKINRSLYRKFENELEQIENENLYSIHCVNLPNLDAAPTSFWFEIVLDGKILWKKNYDIIEWFSRTKNVLCSGKFSRKISSGQPYWVENEK